MRSVIKETERTATRSSIVNHLSHHRIVRSEIQLVIDEIELLECRLDDPEPMIQIRVVCSKGTYIRALARDIGEALHSGAHLTGLIRTRVGDVRLEDCLNPEHFKEWIDGQEIENEEENN